MNKNLNIQIEKGVPYIKLKDVTMLLKEARKEYLKCQTGMIHRTCEEGLTTVRTGKEALKGIEVLLGDFLNPIIAELKKLEKEVREENA
jgi:hypothetical protein